MPGEFGRLERTVCRSPSLRKTRRRKKSASEGICQRHVVTEDVFQNLRVVACRHDDRGPSTNGSGGLSAGLVTAVLSQYSRWQLKTNITHKPLSNHAVSILVLGSLEGGKKPAYVYLRRGLEPCPGVEGVSGGDSSCRTPYGGSNVARQDLRRTVGTATAGETVSLAPPPNASDATDRNPLVGQEHSPVYTRSRTFYQLEFVVFVDDIFRVSVSVVDPGTVSPARRGIYNAGHIPKMSTGAVPDVCQATLLSTFLKPRRQVEPTREDSGEAGRADRAAFYCNAAATFLVTYDNASLAPSLLRLQ
ncbi:hypothetical protein Bbelb_041310 [Branchiostoma belcheri]|nr:hypothetical protein Bbelb_041310 [Branchiostoma belcheri]